MILTFSDVQLHNKRQEIWQNLREDLGKRTIFKKYIPYTSRNQQNKHRVYTCTALSSSRYQNKRREAHGITFTARNTDHHQNIKAAQAIKISSPLSIEPNDSLPCSKESVIFPALSQMSSVHNLFIFYLRPILILSPIYAQVDNQKVKII
jgi:uncharacterized protein (UPF0147 family)